MMTALTVYGLEGKTDHSILKLLKLKMYNHRRKSGCQGSQQKTSKPVYTFDTSLNNTILMPTMYPKVITIRHKGLEQLLYISV